MQIFNGKFSGSNSIPSLWYIHRWKELILTNNRVWAFCVKMSSSFFFAFWSWNSTIFSCFSQQFFSFTDNFFLEQNKKKTLTPFLRTLFNHSKYISFGQHWLIVFTKLKSKFKLQGKNWPFFLEYRHFNFYHCSNIYRKQ